VYEYRYADEKANYVPKSDEEGDDTPKKAKKDKKVGPKGAKSAYIIFSTAMREKVKEDFPDLEPKATMAKVNE
jgi:hypothetical protein